MILRADFFRRPATELAPLLIGKLLCRRVGDAVICRRITETECYFGEEDSACHAHRGKTKRTEVLYREGGIAYVYLCYGMHSLLNVVTGDAGHPEAVLIRGVEGVSGPGRVTRCLGVTTKDNALPLTKESGLWLEDDGAPPPAYVALTRVGIDYADACDRARLWRYLAQEKSE